MKHKAVFLDRDGTIIEFFDKVLRPEEIIPVPGAGKAIRILNDLGYKVIMVTNQPPIEKGEISQAEAEKLNELMLDKLGMDGAVFDAIYMCPHRYSSNCICRKPNPYFLNEAAQRFDLDLGKSFMIGDTTRDIQTGANAGVKTILVGEGDGAKTSNSFDAKADHAVADILTAAELIQKLSSS